MTDMMGAMAVRSGRARSGWARLLPGFLLVTLFSLLLAGCGDDGNKKAKIVTEPADTAVTVGQPATFTVAAKGKKLTYQWNRNGTPVAGATNASYTTPATVAGDNGTKYSVVVTSGKKSVTSREATLTVNVPPSITTQPANAAVVQGNTASFTVAAAGTAPLAYQWRRGGTNIAGATSATYVTPATVPGDDGAQFTVVVSNSYGTVTSSAATLTVNLLPSITTQPANATVAAGATASFSVVATGPGTLTYQWRRNGTNVTGATNASYTTPATVSGDDGAVYSVVVTNANGSTTSANATLTVTASAPGFAGTWGASTLIDNTDFKVHYATSAVNLTTGDGLVAYVQRTASTYAVFVNEYNATTQAWSGPTKLYETGALIAPIYMVDAAIDPFGNVVLAWNQYDGNSLSYVRAIRRTPLGVWGSVATLSSAGVQSTGDVDVALDGFGDAYVAWTQGSSKQVAAVSIIPAAGSAGAPTLLEADTETGDSDYINVVADDNGDAVVVWRRDKPDFSGEQIVARRWAVAGAAGVVSPGLGKTRSGAQAISVEPTWNTLVVLRDTSGSVNYPDAAIDANSGNVLVAWNDEPSGQVANIQYSVYNKTAATWSTAALAESDTTDAGWLEVAAGTGGYGAITWEAANASSSTDVRARLVDLGTAALQGITNVATNGYFPHVGVDAAGDMMVVYTQLQNNVRELTYARYIGRSATGSPTQLNAVLTDSLAWNVSMTTAGPTLIAWEEGARDFFNAFDPRNVYARWFK